MNSLLEIRGVGKQIAKLLERLNIYSIEDLLLHLPTKYQDKTKIVPISGLKIGEEAQMEGDIISLAQPKGGRTRLLVQLSDTSGLIGLRFFSIHPHQIKQFSVAKRLRVFGEVRQGIKSLEIFHPEYAFISEEDGASLPESLTPCYRITQGVSQNRMRQLIAAALNLHGEDKLLQDLIPEALLDDLTLPDLKQALIQVHNPPVDSKIDLLLEKSTISQKRLAFEELLSHRLGCLYAKRLFQSQPAISITSENSSLEERFLQQLPFQLTNAQKRVLQEIKLDLAKDFPMLRLIQGDVGSGKTIVAALSMLHIVQTGAQAVLMAPTAVLAEQHYRVFKQWFESLGIRVALLTGQIQAGERNELLTELIQNKIQIVIGTHALFQSHVIYAKLALLIIDEQHRFGVRERALLREKGLQLGIQPHQMIMTATPIPRSLAMSLYMDLDTSVLDELPPGRTPIITSVMSNRKRSEIVERIRLVCQQGRQVYWVCPFVESSDVLNCEAVLESAKKLQTQLKQLKIGVIHGRLSQKDKEAVMNAFQAGTINILVATTIIEVGVDVPNASLIIIENAERLGLAQLHQLRGRVGRGNIASYCVLLYQEPLNPIAQERLHVMRTTTDGFKISEHDLNLRGPGEFLGTQQTGSVSFRIADLTRDQDLIKSVSEAANKMLMSYPSLVSPLIERWLGNNFQYSEIG